MWCLVDADAQVEPGQLVLEFAQRRDHAQEELLVDARLVREEEVGEPLPVRVEGLDELLEGLLELVLAVRDDVELDADLAELVRPRDEGLEEGLALVTRKKLGLFVRCVPMQALEPTLLDLAREVVFDRTGVEVVHPLQVSTYKWPRIGE